MRSFADHLAHQEDHRPFVRQRFSAGARAVTVADVCYDKPGALRRRATEYVLALHLRPARVAVCVGGRRRPTRAYRAGEFDLTPPETVYASERHDPVAGVGVSLPRAVVAEALEEIAPGFDGDFGALHLGPCASDVVATLCRQLLAELEADAPMGPLYADSLVRALVVELYRCACLSAAPAPAAAGLSDAALATLDAWIDANAASAASLADLAAVADMPAAAFARAVKRRTGATPYQYALRRRLERARGLIGASRASLAQIAYDCGFASQSHMTDLFRAKLGVTPGALRGG